MPPTPAPGPDTRPQAREPIRSEARVVGNLDEGAGNWRITLEVEGWPEANPGQFLMLSAGALGRVARRDPLLPRPMAVYRSRPAAGGAGAEVDVLYKVVGRGTTLLSETLPGQRVGVVGPLGRGFPIAAADVPVALVGGGTGIASLYELARALAPRGPVTVFLGARRAADLMARADFEALGAPLLFTTEDGSLGRKGLVTEALDEWLTGAAERGGPSPVVYACGPTPMMHACAEQAAGRSAACWVSLENTMACGFGVCLGCAAPLSAGGFGLVCRSGPVFEAAEIVWEGLP